LQWHGLCPSLAVLNSYVMEATIITPELLRQLTDDRHLRVVREPVGEHASEEADREREIDTLRDVMYRLWNAEHQRRA